jgi:hypothetical protein
MPTMRFDQQERDRYTIMTERGGPVGMIRRIGDRFVFVDACNIKPSNESFPVYADELEQVVKKLKDLEDELTRADSEIARPKS